MLVVLVVSLLSLLWAPRSSPQTQSQATAQTSDAQTTGVIYVVRRGWHIDIGFAAASLVPSMRPLGERFPDARYIFFGFGDEHYLRAKNRNGPVLLGALWPGPGLILATALHSPPEAAFGERNVVSLQISPAQAEAAQAFIQRSLSQGPSKSYAEGPYEDSIYFAATQKYSAFHTCNTWAAQTLRAAQLPIRSGGVIFAGQLWGPVRALSRRRASLPIPAHTAQSQGGLDPF